MLIIISACVLHNFCLTRIGDQDEDDNDDDDDDGEHGLAQPLLRRAQLKRMHIGGTLH